MSEAPQRSLQKSWMSAGDQAGKKNPDSRFGTLDIVLVCDSHQSAAQLRNMLLVYIALK